MRRYTRANELYSSPLPLVVHHLCYLSTRTNAYSKKCVAQHLKNKKKINSLFFCHECSSFAHFSFAVNAFSSLAYYLSACPPNTVPHGLFCLWCSVVILCMICLHNSCYPYLNWRFSSKEFAKCTYVLLLLTSNRDVATTFLGNEIYATTFSLPVHREQRMPIIFAIRSRRIGLLLLVPIKILKL